MGEARVTTPDGEGRTSLPEGVRARVVDTAAQQLGLWAVADIPLPLRRIARFTPARRARLGAVQIALALERDDGFRERVADAVRTALPELVGAFEAGTPLPALHPEDVAAAAYLLRPAGWPRYVEAATLAAAAADTTAARVADARVVTRLREQLEALRAERRVEGERWRTESATARDESTDLRRRLSEARERARRAEIDSAAALAAAEAALRSAAAARSAAEAETRRLRVRLAEVESALESARRASREARGAVDVRLRLLLDTLVDAAQALRRDLALTPTTARPADAVAEAADISAGDVPVAARGLDADDPMILDELLALPRAHLVVDGYNVTKSGYGGLPLEAQRSRLVVALAALAARTAAEVTVVFDGTDVPGVRTQAPRGVRVIFTPAGEIADDWIRRLVAAEPSGRPVVVVSSDREVADGVRRFGARSVPSYALLRLLARG